MAIRVRDNTVFLEAECSVEEAECFHETLKNLQDPCFDVSGATFIHTAIVQLMMVSLGMIVGLPSDPVVTACLGHRSRANHLEGY
jgi:hypothetical protein